MVRVMRDSPPDEARALAGPDASSRSTRCPWRRRCQAVQAPKTPAPTTIVSQPAGLTAGAAAAGATRTADAATAPATPRISSRRRTLLHPAREPVVDLAVEDAAVLALQDPVVLVGPHQEARGHA